MKVGLVGDTHLPRFGRRIPIALANGLREERVELIVHVGDFTGPEVPALFEAIAPLEAVAGNNDPPALKERFGHSHQPLCERRDSVWLVNPGSPTDKRRQPRYSYAILDVEGGRAEPRLVFFDDRR